MRGLMMDYELTLLPIFDRVGKYFPDVEIVSRLAGQVDPAVRPTGSSTGGCRSWPTRSCAWA